MLKLFKLVCAKISENDSALRRGRIPAHEMKEVMNVSLMLLRAKANLSRHNIMMLNIGLDVLSFNTQQSSLPISARAYQARHDQLSLYVI